MRIYTQNPATLSFYALLSFIFSTLLLYIFRNHKRFTKGACRLLFLVSLYGVFKYSVLGRTPSDHHHFVFFSPYSNEFYRELFMNALLYYPFGLTLTPLLGPWSILCSFLLSISIELWQDISGTDLAQGSDVLMNTQGYLIGVLPWAIVRCIHSHHSSSSSPRTEAI